MMLHLMNIFQILLFHKNIFSIKQVDYLKDYALELHNFKLTFNDNNS